MPERRPNILFVLTDDHAAHAMSSYGSQLNQTPQLDRYVNFGDQPLPLRRSESSEILWRSQLGGGPDSIHPDEALWLHRPTRAR